MTIAALVLAALAAVLHAYIFVLESLRWTDVRTRRTFGVTEEEALVTREMAFNQGFYNLFLAIVTVVGIATFAASHATGAALIYAGAGSMLAAGVVLLASSPSKAKPAIIQLSFPLLTVIALTIALLV